MKQVTFIVCTICYFIMLVLAIMALNQRDGKQKEIDILKQEAIEYGFAQYNKTSGNWEWLAPKVITNGVRPESE